ncbi:hypothetical protein BVC80_9019g35 [Macleaya cordata]|uniref:Uncharacterized protein n=1 Tax=Macleaya cordata TaxID=56857 RepID=A0A200QQJ7_MACCD|nr:hypothetical protein BVC80_9019g35 [Macleaya cordata]
MCTIKINSGSNSSFWWDSWTGDKSLKEEFHQLFKISQSKSGSILDHITNSNTGSDWNIQFTREIRESEIPMLAEMLHKISSPPIIN